MHCLDANSLQKQRNSFKNNDICIVWVLGHCKNNAIHCKINDICIAWTLILCKNNAIHCKSNDICIVWMLSHCKNNVIHCKNNDMCIAWAWVCHFVSQCWLCFVVIPLSYLLSYRCHTLGVDLESGSVLPILSGCLEHKFAPANVPSKFAPCCHTLLSHLVVIPVVNRCCHTRVYVRRLPTQIGTRPY